MAQDRQIPSHFWLQRLSPKIWFGRSANESYWAISLLIPAVIVLGHLIIATFTDGLPRFDNDLGLIFTAAAWIAMLNSINFFTERYVRLVTFLEQTGTSNASGRRIDFVFKTRFMTLSGGLFALGELSIIFLNYPPQFFVTGFKEVPYSGPPLLAMKYTSIPAYIWTNSFWALFFFILGNCVWMMLSTTYILLRFRSTSQSNGDIQVKKRGVELATSMMATAAVSVTAPLAALTPLALSDSLDSSLLPRLAGYYDAVGIGYAVLLIAAIVSLIVARRS